MDRIEYIKELMEHKYTKERKQSIVINNFYTLLTIGMVSIAIILYTNYVVPAQNNKKQRELQQKAKQEYLLKRKKEIELSHKLNGQQNEHK